MESLLTVFSCFMIFINLLTNSHGIGVGLSRFQPRMHSVRNRGVGSVRNPLLTSNDDPNSYAYWNCHTIPPNMTLCKSVGYSKMVLPNFLQHESLREVIQQANVWVALVNTDCHPDIQRFLCSLYAPVCLKSHQEAKIPPCWELCDQVRNACLPRMRLFGFDWPEIVQCGQFPRQAESMCIPPQEDKTVTCAPCEQAITLENIASSYCMADVVLKAALKSVTPQKNRASVSISLKQRTMALKLLRNDGSTLTEWSTKRNRRRRRHRYRSLQARRYRHVMPSAQNHTDPYGPHAWALVQPRPLLSRHTRQAPLLKAHADESSKQRRNAEGSRRNRRSSRLYELDGITELILDCSTCSRLLPFIGGPEDNQLLANQKWLIMGRRIRDEKTKAFTNQLQVTFLTAWDRGSAEFRRALSTVRRVPVTNMCSEQTSKVIRKAPQSATTRELIDHRNLKMLRSAPMQPPYPRSPQQQFMVPQLRHIQRYPYQSHGVVSNNMQESRASPGTQQPSQGQVVPSAHKDNGHNNATISTLNNPNGPSTGQLVSDKGKYNHNLDPSKQRSGWSGSAPSAAQQPSSGSAQVSSWYRTDQNKRYWNRQRRREQRQARRREKRKRMKYESTGKTADSSLSQSEVKPINPYQNEEQSSVYHNSRCCTEIWCRDRC